MTMNPNRRKFVLTTHITLSGGWIGAVFAYLVLVAAAMSSEDDHVLRSAWIAMNLIGWYLIVPLALVSLLTGIVMSLGTRWGLLRHYWVLASFVLTVVATGVLLKHMPTVSFFASVATAVDQANIGQLREALRGELLHAGVGVLLLLGIQALNVYKPQGVTAYGRHRTTPSTSTSPSASSAEPAAVGAITRTPRWVQIVGIHAVVLAILVVVFHVAGGGMGRH